MIDIGIKEILSTISPTLTTKLMFYYNFRKRLNLRSPKDFNEKLQYLKLKTYYKNPVITKCVDKYEVRDYLIEKKLDFLLPKLIGGGTIMPMR